MCISLYVAAAQQRLPYRRERAMHFMENGFSRFGPTEHEADWSARFKIAGHNLAARKFLVAYDPWLGAC
jgi:hypothetical protein